MSSAVNQVDACHEQTPVYLGYLNAPVGYFEKVKPFAVQQWYLST